jgi:cytochrome oxidase Cu insertion factor (SCO1/SenC/PrrC family)
LPIALTPRGESSNLAAEPSAGGPFTLKDLGGKPFAIYFGFTRCCSHSS